MIIVRRELTSLLKGITSGITAFLLVFFISSLMGVDLFLNNETIDAMKDLSREIEVELVGGGIENRIKQLGEVPAVEPYRRFYCIEFAKELHALSEFTQKQRILSDIYNVRDFETQLIRIMKYTETADMESLQDELDIIKRELKNAANLLERRQRQLTRQRLAYVAFFFALWVILFMYYSHGMVLRNR